MGGGEKGLKAGDENEAEGNAIEGIFKSFPRPGNNEQGYSNAATKPVRGYIFVRVFSFSLTFEKGYEPKRARTSGQLTVPSLSLR